MSSVRRFLPWLILVGVIVVAVVLAVVLLGGSGDESGTAETVTSTATGGTTTTVTDPAVEDLQRVMTRLGYYSGPIDGVYGPATSAGVTEMQKALGIEADGVFGATTEAALKGKGKDVVVQIQTELAKYGYYTGPVDGDYGPGTSAAVQKLQADLGVTADGRVGAETVAAFNKAVADGTLQPSTTRPRRPRREPPRRRPPERRRVRPPRRPLQPRPRLRQRPPPSRAFGEAAAVRRLSCHGLRRRRRAPNCRSLDRRSTSPRSCSREATGRLPRLGVSCTPAGLGRLHRRHSTA